MTPQEFKAWFDGFSEGITGTPTDKQWERIKARVAEIDNVAITYPVFVDRYWVKRDPCRWSPYVPWTSGTDLNSNQYVINRSGSHPADGFDSRTAMHAAGKADFESLS